MKAILELESKLREQGESDKNKSVEVPKKRSKTIAKIEVENVKVSF